MLYGDGHFLGHWEHHECVNMRFCPLPKSTVSTQMNSTIKADFLYLRHIQSGDTKVSLKRLLLFCDRT